MHRIAANQSFHCHHRRFNWGSSDHMAQSEQQRKSSRYHRDRGRAFGSIRGVLRRDETGSCKFIESMPQLGGQLSALYPEKYIYDVAGFPKMRAQELVDNLKRRWNIFPVEICLEEKVPKSSNAASATFEVITAKGSITQGPSSSPQASAPSNRASWNCRKPNNTKRATCIILSRHAAFSKTATC